MNRSGMLALDFPLYYAMDNVFARDHSFKEIDGLLPVEANDFAQSNARDLATFVDNHDNPRFMTHNSDPRRLNEALAFLLTARGVPVIYYGTEQYLHNDTNGGSDAPC